MEEEKKEGMTDEWGSSIFAHLDLLAFIFPPLNANSFKHSEEFGNCTSPSNSSSFSERGTLTLNIEKC